MERIVILVLIAVTVGDVVGVGAFVIRDSQYPAAIEADDPTDSWSSPLPGCRRSSTKSRRSGCANRR